MSEAAQHLTQFHTTFDLPQRIQPVMPPQAERDLRHTLMREEAAECIQALADPGASMESIAQELADVVYIAYGTALTYGIPLDDVLREVHAANMRKIGPDGPIRREDGKITKPEGWRPPDIRTALGL